MRFYVLWYYIYVNDQSYELNRIINKDVLWFFIKLVLQKTHDNVCCALTPRYNLLQELENVFVKHYAPSHMPDPKGEWSLKVIIQNFITETFKCQISGSYPKQFFSYFVHKAVPIQMPVSEKGE